MIVGVWLLVIYFALHFGVMRLLSGDHLRAKSLRLDLILEELRNSFIYQQMV